MKTNNCVGNFDIKTECSKSKEEELKHVQKIETIYRNHKENRIWYDYQKNLLSVPDEEIGQFDKLRHIQLRNPLSIPPMTTKSKRWYPCSICEY
jgi:hypothetical protein